MILWIILTLMVALAVAGVSIPLVRRYETRVDQRAATLAVLKDQLAEIDGQEKAGVVAGPEAEALRVELRRRLLVESREIHAEARPIGAQNLGRFAFGMAAIVALAATGLYAMMGRPDLTGEPVATAGGPAATEGGEDVDGLIRGLEQRMEANPSDPEGWRMLGWSYFQRGRFGESANAYRRAVALAPTAPGFQSAFGEALVQASQGNVTPEAAAAFEAAQKLDPSDARARYFLAVAKDQRGDRAGAITDWVNLLNEAPADAPWAPDLRQFVERIAKEDGIDLAGRLKPAAVAAAPVASMPVAGATGAMPQPSQEQVRDAMALPEADRQAMVRGMVDGLAARLQTSPRDSDGWVRLMRARMVLGERDGASAALKSGLAAFGDAPAEQQKLRDAAAALGVPGA
ncbi:c-type cytochrome biogenesis protein CcmI [Sphingoaurantiacus capsulatus]|uniref:C-type cytochrome biogenesis protein CcmI n=1 Tax=Sphingoaurantiacus capsulatus TaxID=1771310 RepID=A0ABV7XB38_9SPHN